MPRLKLREARMPPRVHQVSSLEKPLRGRTFALASLLTMKNERVGQSSAPISSEDYAEHASAGTVDACQASLWG